MAARVEPDRQRLTLLLVGAAVVASLWLRSGFPVHAIGNAIVDDALFLRLAKAVAAGRWLGPFDELTLAKGPVYPVFVAGSFLAGLPLKLAEQLVFIAASLWLSRCLAVRAGHPTIALTLFVTLAFIPVVWSVDLARVIREGLYLGLSLAVFGVAVSVSLGDPEARHRWPAGFGLGLLVGAFWLTREEGVWLVPALLVLALAGLGWLGWRVWCRRLLAVAAGFGLVIGSVAALNWGRYGVLETVDVRAASFQRAYGALSRIGPAPRPPLVVFPAEARALAYQVSPAARELQPFFEGPPGEAWRQTGCRETGQAECPEILSGWFQWALRDAVRQAGHYASGPDAFRFYDRLASEIDAACAAGTVGCQPPRTSLAPPFRQEYLRGTARSAASLLAILLRLGGDQVGSTSSSGTPADLAWFAGLVGPIAQTPKTIVEISGRTATGKLRIEPAGWSTTLTDDATSGAFTIATDCPPERCSLVVSVDGRDVFKLPLTQLPPRTEDGGIMLQIDRIRPMSSGREAWLRDRAILPVARGIGWAYAMLGPPALILGALGVIATPVFRPWAVRTPLFIVAAASMVAVLCRIVVLAYVDVTAFPSVNLLYLSPAIPFAIVVAVCGSALLVSLRRR